MGRHGDRPGTSHSPPIGAHDQTNNDANLAALEVLYETYGRQSLAVAYRLLGDVDEAEDVVQEVFVAAWRAGAHSKASARSWILTMARNRAVDRLRARNRRPVQPLEHGNWEVAAEVDVAGHAIAAVDGDALRRALGSLSTEHREAIELAYCVGLSHSEIAERLGLPLGTVKSRIRLALDRLRTRLER